MKPPYLTYEAYADSNRSLLTQSAFNYVIDDASDYLDAVTYLRLRTLEADGNDIDEDFTNEEKINKVMIRLVELFPQPGQEKVTSYSNGISSWNFEGVSWHNQASSVIMTLPVWLISAVVG
jgi:hypothetical protein